METTTTTTTTKEELPEARRQWTDIVSKAGELPRALTPEESAQIKDIIAKFYFPVAFRERWPLSAIQELSVRLVERGQVPCIHGKIEGKDNWITFGKGNLRYTTRGSSTWFKRQAHRAIQDDLKQWRKANPVPAAVVADEAEVDKRREVERAERDAARIERHAASVAEAMAEGKPAPPPLKERKPRDENAAKRDEDERGPRPCHEPFWLTAFEAFFESIGSPIALSPEHLDQWAAYHKKEFLTADCSGKLVWVTSHEFGRRMAEFRNAHEAKGNRGRGRGGRGRGGRGRGGRGRRNRGRGAATEG